MIDPKVIEEQILQVCPEIIDREEDIKGIRIQFHLETGMRGLETSIQIGSNHLKMNASQKYPFRIKKQECMTFNANVSANYAGYQIYGSEDKLSITRRMTYNNGIDNFAEITEDFLDTAKTIALDYEIQCVDFSEKIQSFQCEEDNQTEEKIVPEDDEESTGDKSEEIIEEFFIHQRQYSQEAFEDLAASIGEKIIDLDSEKMFIKKTEYGELRAVMDTESEMINFSYTIPEENSTRAYLAIADIQAACPDCRAVYNNRSIQMQQYVIPDPFNKDGLKKAYTALLSAYKKPEEQRTEVSVAKNLNMVMEQQAEVLLKREEAITAKEDEVKAKKKELEDKENALEKEREDLLKKFETMRKEFNEKMNLLKEKEAALDEQLKTVEGEKGKYILNMDKLTSRLAVMQARGSGELQGNSSDDMVFKLQSQVRSLTQNRVFIEKELERKTNEWRDKENAYLDQIREREKECSEMRASIQRDLEQEYAQEKLEYEKRIKELEPDDETMHEANSEGFYNYLVQSGSFGQVRRLHAKEQEIISYNLGDLSVKVAFGKLIFADVSKIMKSKNMKTLSVLNNTVSDVKFFFREKEGEVVARKYLSFYEHYADMAEAVNRITEHFA